MELVELSAVPRDIKVKLLEALGYYLDARDFVVDGTGKRVRDRYTNEEVTLSTMDILPDRKGHPVFINDNILSLASYFEEVGEGGIGHE